MYHRWLVLVFIWKLASDCDKFFLLLFSLFTLHNFVVILQILDSLIHFSFFSLSVFLFCFPPKSESHSHNLYSPCLGFQSTPHALTFRFEKLLSILHLDQWFFLSDSKSVSPSFQGILYFCHNVFSFFHILLILKFFLSAYISHLFLWHSLLFLLEPLRC